MFLVVHNGFVICGPYTWHPFRFSDIIKEETEVDVTLPLSNDNREIIYVSTATDNTITIYPCVINTPPPYNPNVEIAHGPLWEYTDTQAIGTYEIVPMSVDQSRGFFKQLAADARWRKQTADVPYTVGGTEYNFFPNDFISLSQYINAGFDSVNWKIGGEVWIVLTKDDMINITNAMIAQKRSAFDWENATLSTINSAETTSDLLNISMS